MALCLQACDLQDHRPLENLHPHRWMSVSVAADPHAPTYLYALYKTTRDGNLLNWCQTFEAEALSPRVRAEPILTVPATGGVARAMIAMDKFHPGSCGWKFYWPDIIIGGLHAPQSYAAILDNPLFDERGHLRGAPITYETVLDRRIQVNCSAERMRFLDPTGVTTPVMWTCEQAVERHNASASSLEVRVKLTSYKVDPTSFDLNGMAER